MREDQEKQILQWVYATAQDEIQKVDHILEKLNRGKSSLVPDLYNPLDKAFVENDEIEDKMLELISYQYELQRFLNKISLRMDLNMSKKMEEVPILYDMKSRTEQMKYQIHENKEAGIYAWEMAKELIELQEDLMKKYQIPWQ